MPTHRKVTNISSGAYKIQSSKSVSPSIETYLNGTVPDGSTDLQFSIFVEATNLRSLHIQGDQALTVKTNSSGAPQETFTLDGVDPSSWVEGEGVSPIAGDVTSVYVTNASGSDAEFEILAGWE